MASVAEFLTSWWAWWANLQPTWRDLHGQNLSKDLPPDGEQWLKISKAGCNGIFLIVLLLGCWIRTEEKAEGTTYLNALRDLEWVITQLIRSLKLQKRMAESSDSDSERSSKKR
jgi:hypothetical protein